ncbi:MAG: gfo/Idh/MocA family oxidoreductase [Ignavibacteriae bacterium]|nr:MAG: gfo/Idh/MocA family oxidoreductase [Ignavibacteriota bacterium]
MKKDKSKIGLGVIGFGSFAMFAIQHFTQIPDTKLIGLAGTHREAADAAAKRFDAVHYDTIDELVNNPDVDLVYIATPPFLHYEQSMMALIAGKNVICEKPLAVNIAQAEEMVSLARKKGLLMAVNLMQRYNPMYKCVKEIIDKKPMGELLHGFFENYASDEGLSPEHWFWDKEKSGGIFVEHGVHFFDMLDGWTGVKGEVQCAQSIIRPGTNIEEQVNCTSKYGDTVLFNFYHGFTQPGRMDRQELRLLFERGDLTLFEWIPTRIKIHALLDEAESKIIHDIFPEARINITNFFAGKYREITSRHKEKNIYQMLDLYYGFEDEKMHIYGNIVRALFEDQIAWIRNKAHKRIITEDNGYQSLLNAVRAMEIAG